MNYGELLLRGAERSTYRKRPIDTLNDIEQIKQKIKSNKIAGKDVKIKQYEQQSKTGQAISEAKRKSGKKAFDEQIKLGKLSSKLLELKRKGATENDISEFYNKELKLEKLEKELNSLKDEPEKYLAKLQEINQLKNEENSNRKILDQLRSQNASLSTLTTLYSGLLSPEQLLKSLPDFQDLTPKEREFALKTLRNQVKRDPTSQKAFLQELAQQPKESIDRLKKGIKLEVLRLESEKPIKAKAVELKETKGSKKKQAAELTYEAMDRVKQVFYDLMKQTRFDSVEQENYVGQQINLLIEEGSIREEADLVNIINGQIDRFIKTYNYDKRKPTDVLFREAKADEQQVEQEGAEIRGAMSNVAENVASAQLGEVHPELQQIQPVLEQQFQVDDQLEPEQAQADALDVVQGVTQDLNRYSLQGPQLTEPVLNLERKQEASPEYPPTPFESIPSDQIINSMTEQSLKRLLYQFNVPFNDSDTEIELRRKLKTEKRKKLKIEPFLPSEQLLLGYQPAKSDYLKRKENEALEREQDAESIRKWGLKEVDYADDDDDDTIFRKVKHNNNIRSLSRVQEGEKVTDADIAAILTATGKREQAQAPARRQEKFKTNDAYNAFETIPETGVLSKQQLDKLNLKDLQQISQDLGLNVEGKKNLKQSHINAIQKYKSGKGFKPKKSTGKGFTPLSHYPHELIAGSLAHHINRVRNKRKLLNVHLHNPFQNTENQEYRKNLTKHTITNLLN